MHDESYDRYQFALQEGQKRSRERSTAGEDPSLPVLDTLLEAEDVQGTIVELPVAEIPLRLVVGVKSAGRGSAFTEDFLPLLPADSEFALKWMNLCRAHLDSGIRDPILCYEYLGRFYVEEGNKRVSVLKRFGAVRVRARIRRVVPPYSEELRIRAYYRPIVSQDGELKNGGSHSFTREELLLMGWLCENVEGYFPGIATF